MRIETIRDNLLRPVHSPPASGCDHRDFTFSHLGGKFSLSISLASVTFLIKPRSMEMGHWSLRSKVCNISESRIRLTIGTKSSCKRLPKDI